MKKRFIIGILSFVFLVLGTSPIHAEVKREPEKEAVFTTETIQPISIEILLPSLDFRVSNENKIYTNKLDFSGKFVGINSQYYVDFRRWPDDTGLISFLYNDNRKSKYIPYSPRKPKLNSVQRFENRVKLE